MTDSRTNGGSRLRVRERFSLMTSIRLFVLGACLCTMMAYSFFSAVVFRVFNVFFRVFKMFLVGLATGRAVVFYE